MEGINPRSRPGGGSHRSRHPRRPLPHAHCLTRSQAASSTSTSRLSPTPSTPATISCTLSAQRPPSPNSVSATTCASAAPSALAISMVFAVPSSTSTTDGPLSACTAPSDVSTPARSAVHRSPSRSSPVDPRRQLTDTTEPPQTTRVLAGSPPPPAVFTNAARWALCPATAGVGTATPVSLRAETQRRSAKSTVPFRRLVPRRLVRQARG